MKRKTRRLGRQIRRWFYVFAGAVMAFNAVLYYASGDETNPWLYLLLIALLFWEKAIKGNC